jgi:hypothetical protein
MTPGQLLWSLAWSVTLAGSIVLYVNAESPALAGKPVAFLQDHQGLVEFRGPDFSVWSKAKGQQGFTKGTTVATSSRAMARIAIGSDQILNVGENSQVVIGDPSEFRLEQDFYVNVLRGELKLETADSSAVQSAKQLSKNKAVIIESGTLTATIDQKSKTTLSILKEAGQPAQIAALKGGALVADQVQGTTNVVGTVAPKNPLVAFFLPDSPKVDVQLQAPKDPEPSTTITEPAPDVADYVQGFRNVSGLSERHIITVSPTHYPRKVAVRFEHPDDPFWRAAHEPPKIRLAANGRLSKETLSRQTTAGITQIEHLFKLPNQEKDELIKNGFVRLELRPAAQNPSTGRHELAAERGSQALSVTSMQHPKSQGFRILVAEPKIDGRPLDELPVDMELNPMTTVPGKGLWVEQHNTAALPFVHRLLAGSMQSPMRLDWQPNETAQTASSRTPLGRSLSVVHVVKGGALVATLASQSKPTLSDFGRGALDLTKADFVHDGDPNEVMTTKALTTQEWQRLSQRTQVLAYCRPMEQGRLVTLDGRLLQRFPDLKRVVTSACPNVFNKSRSLGTFVVRRGY